MLRRDRITNLETECGGLVRGELDLVGAVVPVDNLRGHLKKRTLRGINLSMT